MFFLLYLIALVEQQARSGYFTFIFDEKTPQYFCLLQGRFFSHQF